MDAFLNQLDLYHLTEPNCPGTIERQLQPSNEVESDGNSPGTRQLCSQNANQAGCALYNIDPAGLNRSTDLSPQGQHVALFPAHNGPQRSPLYFKRASRWTAAMFVFGTLASQASASTVGIWQREGGIANYDGPGTLIKDLGTDLEKVAVRPKLNAVFARAFSKDSAAELLGGDSIVDCPPNGLTKWEDSVSASTLFVDSMANAPMDLKPGLCVHKEVASTLAQVCNRGKSNIELTPQQAQTAFDLLQDTCTSRESSGTIQTADGAQYAIFAKVGVNASSGRRRSPGQLSKRCIDPSGTTVNGCESNVCKPKISLNDQGDCPNVGNVDSMDGCSYYCEIKVAKYYGAPVLYDNTRFCAGTDCTLEEGESFTVEKSISVSFGLEGAGPLESVLSAGISFGISFATTSSLTQTYSFGNGKCGWWYKVPVMIHTCGSLSEYTPNGSGSETSPPYCAIDAPFKRTVGNACAEVQATSINSNSPDVIIVPRWYNCGDRSELPMDQNSPSWKDTYGGDNDVVHTC